MMRSKWRARDLRTNTWWFFVSGKALGVLDKWFEKSQTYVVLAADRRGRDQDILDEEWGWPLGFKRCVTSVKK